MESSAKIDVNTSTSAIYGYEVMIAFGAGSFAQASFAVIQTIVTPAEMSYGITFMLIGTYCSKFCSFRIYDILPAFADTFCFNQPN